MVACRLGLRALEIPTGPREGICLDELRDALQRWRGSTASVSMRSLRRRAACMRLPSKAISAAVNR